MNDISVSLSADDRALLQTLREAGVDIQQFARKGAGALRELEDSSRTSATGIEKMAGGLKTAFIGGGVAAAIITIKNAIGDTTMAMIDAQMQADKVKNSLTFAMGGPQAAQEIDYLRQVTDKLGVSFAAVAPMYGRLAAATKGTNLEGRATREIFESIAQASVVMGLGVEETEGAMRALVQMVSKGQIQAEELRGQMGERLPRAFQIFAESMGKSTGELSKMLEMGEVGPERLAQFAATLKGELAGGLDEATTRLAANVNRLDNAWLQLKQNVGEAGVSSFMAGQMAILADATGDVAKSMEAARKGGDGFLGQMAAAGGALLRFANPFNAITYNVQDQATELKIAQDQLREFEALLGKEPNNVFLIRGIAQLKETVAWLQAANSEKDKFAASGPSHRTMEDNSMKALAEQQAKDAKELADIKAKLMGVDKDYLPTLNKLNDAYRAGNLTQKEYVGLVGELAKKNYTAAKATATHADAFGDFVRKLNEKLAAQAQELDAGRKLTDSEKLRIQFAEELGTKYKNLSAAQLAKVDGLLKAIAAGEEQARATRRLVAAYQAELDVMAELDAAYVAASKAREQGRLAVDAYVQGIAASAEQVALEQSLFGQSARNRAIALEQYQIELDLKKQIAAINANAGFNQAQRDEEIARATAAAAIAKASAVAKADMAALQSLVDAFDNTAHDVFVNIFNDGSNAFKKLGQSLKAGLIDVLYQLTLKRWIISIGASISGVGGASSASAGGLSDIGSLFSGGSSIYSAATGAAGIFGSTAAYAAAMGGGSMAAGSQAAMLAAQTGVFGAEGLALTAAASGGMAGAMAPVLQGLMTAAPYLAAVAAVYAIAKSLDHSGTPHTGGGAMYSAGTGLQTQGLANGWSGGGAYLTDFGGYKVASDATQMQAGLVQSIVGILDSTATTFGKTAGYTAAAAFADDSDKNAGAWGALVIQQLDKKLVEWGQWANGPGGTTFSDGAAGSAEYLAKVSSDVQAQLKEILSGTDWALAMVDALGAAPTLQQLADTVQQITATQTALERMGKTLVGFSAMGETAVGKLIDASGGINNLAANASTYYDNFYTEGEKQAATLKTVSDAFAAVSVPMPATREAFRTLVESLEATADTNPYASAALATVLSMSGAFASVVPAAEAAAEAAADTGTAVIETAQEIATLEQALAALRNPVRSIEDIAQGIFNLESEGRNLQVELWRAYGDSNSLLAANALQRDIETAGMTAQEVALYDLNQQRRSEIDAIAAQRQAAAEGVASWQAYFDLFATPEEKQRHARNTVQAVLPSDVDTMQEYKDYVWQLTVQFGVGSAEMKAATDVARDFVIAFPEVATSLEETAAVVTRLTSDLSAFHSGFFTASEQAALAGDAMTASLQALGLSTLPATNAEFRALALGIDTSTDAGKLLFNGLMGLAGEFARLHPLVTTVTEVVQTLDSAIASLRASGASRTVEQIASNMLSLEDQIFELANAGNTAALRQRKLDGLSEVADAVTGLSERDLQNMVWSMQDAAQAALDLAAADKVAADEAARAAETIASEMQRAAEAAAAAAQRIAQEHDGLWRQWLAANEDTAALRALDLAALDPSNRALQEQIWALEDQKKAADEAASAAEQMKSAWSSLTDSITDEVRRIRGLIDEASGASYASLQAQFALATAQTRAGDQAAAKLLPGLSQSMLSAYESQASSLVDLQRLRALTANSLEQTASLLGGGAYFSATGAAPGAYTAGPATYASAATTAPAYGLANMVAELRAEIGALKEEVRGLRGEQKATSEAIVINTGKTARLNQKWDDVGLPITTETDLVAAYGA